MIFNGDAMRDSGGGACKAKDGTLLPLRTARRYRPSGSPLGVLYFYCEGLGTVVARLHEP